MSVAAGYNHRCWKFPLTTAGASERAGFIDAPQAGPANIAPKPTTPPIAIAAVIPFSFAPVDTLKIVSIKIAVNTTSSTNA